MVWHIHDGSTAVLLEQAGRLFSPRLVKIRSQRSTTLLRLNGRVQQLWFPRPQQAIEAAVKSVASYDLDRRVACCPASGLDEVVTIRWRTPPKRN
jgi:hypothetical protein